MRARPRTKERDVWQYRTGAPRPRWVLTCTEWRDGELWLLRRSGKQPVELGEWLIRDLDGEPTWLPDRDFRVLYEITSN